ncbi:MAG: hypothetical protein OES15_08730 [Nitrosopumilus sp.]|nr:hypothetical protein [Nitrosopumilus sp.]
MIQITRTTHIKSGILYNKLKDIGKFKTEQRLVNLNADRKRLWFEDLREMNDEISIDSMPISMSFVNWKRQGYEESK